MIIKNKNSLTFISIDCGKSYMTYYMLKSFLAFSLNIDFIILITNKNEYLYMLDEFKTYKNIKFIYYDKYQNLSFNGSIKHMLNINYLVNNYVNTEYFLLCDNDIIFHNLDILKYYKNYDICGYYENNADFYLSILYYMDILNVNFLSALDYIKKNKNIIHFNNYKIKYNRTSYNNYIYYARFVPFLISIKTEYYKKYNKQFIFYSGNHKNNYYYIDTLSYFTYCIFKNKLNHYIYDITNDINHYGNGMNKTYDEYLSIINNNINKLYN